MGGAEGGGGAGGGGVGGAFGGGGSSSGGGAGAPLCAGGMVEPTSQHCYFHVTEKATWQAAKAACESHGADFHLAAITTAKELEFVLLLIADPINHGTFIGGNDLQVEGTFEWTTGEPWWNGAWLPMEPNDAGAGQDCVSLKKMGDSFGFDDTSCGLVSHYMCEQP